ncbi:hypothetical protein LOAG_00355 [Loa loa]|uniref:Uncharacterized protein n=1 Tax=Loa loa TaxID=7209 RepID=A0A1S0UBW8_LOALO|nr:hypothetical protein LOAG_00355 [Loa loa]EFO28121.1 hypothetical protein LOAG_00355 [Loa loa]
MENVTCRPGFYLYGHIDQQIDYDLYNRDFTVLISQLSVLYSFDEVFVNFYEHDDQKAAKYLKAMNKQPQVNKKRIADTTGPFPVNYFSNINFYPPFSLSTFGTVQYYCTNTFASQEPINYSVDVLQSPMCAAQSVVVQQQQRFSDIYSDLQDSGFALTKSPQISDTYKFVVPMNEK